MIDVLEVYRVSSRTILSLGQNILALTLVENEKPEAYIRLENQPFVLSDDIEYHTKVVTAHKLSQYVNRIHKIRLEDDIETWLDILIQDDIEDRERIINL